jgi:hypothetical protein
MTMGNPKDTAADDPLRQEAGEAGANRQVLDSIFKSGEEARRAGTPLTDNPYALGSDERREWSAGYCATPELDEQDPEPNSGYVKN